MANNGNSHHPNNGQAFWDFIQAFDPHRVRGPGTGVDHAQEGFGSGFPFEGPWAHGGPWAAPWGSPLWDGANFNHPHHGRRAHSPGGGGHRADEDEQSHGHHAGHGAENEESPETLSGSPGVSPAERNGPSPGGPHPPPPHRHHSHPHIRRGRMGHCGRGGRGGRGGPHGRHGPRGHPLAYDGPFDVRPIMHALSSHPLAQGVRDYVEQARASSQMPQEHQRQQDDSFVPPLDTFTTEKAYVIHISLPGAVKEDVGVNWDAENSLLNVAGVVYRPGSEEFIQCLTSSERRVGMFERSVKLPPPEVDEKEDIDAFGITARMDNGILIITVPKMEKETWTEIHKVDVE
ncbi:heat shock 16 [Apiospora marii]|uniref:heat shock 16 n=1 Tax=Apiospora marii TaxID=335849 RepID=UPI00312D1358